MNTRAAVVFLILFGAMLAAFVAPVPENLRLPAEGIIVPLRLGVLVFAGLAIGPALSMVACSFVPDKFNDTKARPLAMALITVALAAAVAVIPNPAGTEYSASGLEVTRLTILASFIAYGAIATFVEVKALRKSAAVQEAPAS